MTDVETRPLPDIPVSGEVLEKSDRTPWTAYPGKVVRHPVVRQPVIHLGYIPSGLWVLIRMIYERRSTARFDRAIRACQSTGSHGDAQDWEGLRQRFLEDRHDRFVDRAELALTLLRSAPWIVGGGAATLLFLGLCLAITEKHIALVAAPFLWVVHAVSSCINLVAVAGIPCLLALACASPFVLWHLGRKYSGTDFAPAWLRTSAEDIDEAIDENTISRALAALRIPQLTEHLIKNRLPLQFVTACRQVGRGTHCQVRLPAGVPAERIMRRRVDLASGLYRGTREVWPGVGSEASILDLWVADKHALDEGAGPYPLLESGFVDVFKGAPFGRTLKGDPVDAPMMERNTIIGGQPGQGKSSAAKTLLLAAALDWRAELRIYVPDMNYDFAAFEPRCSRYVMGADDESIERIRDELRELEAEVQHRGELLVKYEQPSVTPELAAAGIGLHPLFVLLEECHVAFQHEEFGKDIQKSFINVVRLGRKRGIHLIPSTQAPTKDSIPRDITRNCTNGIAFAVSDHVANDALLGQGAYKGGHRATELLPGTDKGTAIVKGFEGERSMAVQVYFVDSSRDNDQVTPIIERSLAEIARRGKPVPGTGTRVAVEKRNLLEDLAEVLGEDRVLARDAVGLLRDLAPRWQPYKDMNATSLRKELAALGVKTVNLSGRHHVDPAEVRRVLADRQLGESEN